MLGYGGYCLFVTGNKNMYFYDGGKCQVNLRTMDATSDTPVMFINDYCRGLFVDTNNTLYCTISNMHQVSAKSLNDPTNTLKEVAGTSCYGSASNMLYYPAGIFVDLNFSLLVADSNNNRIQRFNPGQTNATTVAGMGAPGTISLILPNAIVLDGNGYLFIVDTDNHRIIASGPDGFRCVAGCMNSSGPASNQLSHPQGMSFDSDGNMWVADYDNRRVQKFILNNRTTGKHDLIAPNVCAVFLTLVESQHVQSGDAKRHALCLAGGTPLSVYVHSTCLLFDQNSGNVDGVESVFLILGVSFNQPKLCPYATWNSSGITFADNSTIGMSPRSIFINTDNTVYAVNYQNGQVQIWLEGSASPTGTIFTNATNPNSLFVGTISDIYVDNGNAYQRVDVWRENAANYQSTLSVSGSCYGLFIDSNNSLYCSLHDSHQVIKRSLNSSDSQQTIVAGISCPGYLPHQLYSPNGIFVTLSFDLYVADTGNGRIQLFRSGEVNATTVAGREAPGTIRLHRPTAVILDADGNLFITDSYNHRIVRLVPAGFWCVIGCTAGEGSGSDQLRYSRSMAFDSYGNIFVADTNNNRIQKFMLSSSNCSKLLA